MNRDCIGIENDEYKEALDTLSTLVASGKVSLNFPKNIMCAIDYLSTNEGSKKVDATLESLMKNYGV